MAQTVLSTLVGDICVFRSHDSKSSVNNSEVEDAFPRHTFEDFHLSFRKLLTMQESLAKHWMCPRGCFLVGIIKQNMNGEESRAQLGRAKQ